MAKRTFDFLLALTGLIVVSPLLAVIALLIKLDSRGPVFFRQERVGRHGRPFRIFKFRTMVDRAYQLGPRLTQKHDPRVTRIGQILRWLKLDELPQLINVIRGEMSFVGPRPEDPHFVKLYSKEEREALSVRPGVVGPSQIMGRDELELYPEGADTEEYYIRYILPDKLHRDLDYVRHASLLHDFKLLLHGVGVTFFGSFKGKYFRLNREKIDFVVLDTLLSFGTYLLAFGLKFDWTITPQSIPYLALACVSILILRPPCFIYFGLYQNILKYLGTTEFVAVIKAATLGTILISASLYVFGLGSHSRAVLAIDWMLLVVLLFGYRLFLMARAERRSRSGIPALIVGVTNMGEDLARELNRNPSLGYHPVAFLDDDPQKRGALIHGVQVVGTTRDLPHVARLKGVRMVLIPYPLSANGELQDLIDKCQNHSLDYRLVPALDHFLTDPVSVPEVLAAANGDGHGENGGALGNGNGKVDHEMRPTLVRKAPMVLVTGGAGYVGSHLVRKLLARNYRVRVLDTFLYGDHGIRECVDHPRLEIIEGDVRHLGTLTRAAKGISGVIHLAALVGDAACEMDPEETIAINYESVRLLADVCQRQSVKRLVFASSCSVYGANSDLVLNEGSWLNPVSLYARTRIQSEEVLLRHADHFEVVILRLSTVFGLSTRMRFDLLVNTMTMNAVVNGKIVVFGGDQWRPNLHVQDAAEAFIMGLEGPAEKIHKEIFNVGANESNHSILDVARLVHKHVPQANLEIKTEIPDKRDYRVGFDKIRFILGFQPRYTVEHGIQEIAEAFSKGLIPNPTAEIYHNFRYLEKHGFHRAPGRLYSKEAGTTSGY